MEFLNSSTPLPIGFNVYPWMAIKAESVKCNTMTQLNPSNKGIIKYVAANKSATVTPVVQGVRNPLYASNEARIDRSEGSDDPPNERNHHPFWPGDHGSEFFAELSFSPPDNQGKTWNIKASILGTVKNTTVDATSNALKIKFFVYKNSNPPTDVRTVECDGEVYYNGTEQWLFQGKAIIPFIPSDSTDSFLLCKPIVFVENGFGQGISQHNLVFSNMVVEYEIERVD
jgi:hypothetical protein